MRIVKFMGALLLVLAAFSCAIFGDVSRDNPGFSEVPGTFQGRFLALSDADMAGTAYADGKLEPLSGQQDELTLFKDGAVVHTIAAPNSVISWPTVLNVSPDGKQAYVLETFGSLGEGVAKVENIYKDFPDGKVLTIYDITEDKLAVRESLEQVGLRGQSVEHVKGKPILVIASQAKDAELVTLMVKADGKTTNRKTFALTPPYYAIDKEHSMRNIAVSPDGVQFAVNVSNRRVQFYQMSFDEEGVPKGIRPEGDPVRFGVRLATMKWTPDGRYLLVTDVNSYDSPLKMLTQKGGQVHVLQPPTGGKNGRVINSVRVGRFAEGVEISDDGTLVASIATGRTYLPEILPLTMWPKRRTYALTLLALDKKTGQLTKLDEIRAGGVLPEDVIFDETGKNLAVAVFHRRKGQDRERGFIDFFTITEGQKLMAQGKTQAVMRGPHDLVRVP